MMTLSTILNKAFRKNKKIQSIDADLYMEYKKAEKELNLAQYKFDHATSEQEVNVAIGLIQSAEIKYNTLLTLYRNNRRV